MLLGSGPSFLAYPAPCPANVVRDLVLSSSLHVQPTCLCGELACHGSHDPRTADAPSATAPRRRRCCRARGRRLRSVAAAERPTAVPGVLARDRRLGRGGPALSLRPPPPARAHLH